MAIPLSPADQRYADALEFLYHEADLLDTGHFLEWLDLLTPDIQYVMPVRLNRGGGEGAERAGNSEIFRDDHASLEVRVRRLGTNHAWSESPPSRTRHFVTNVRVFAAPEPLELAVTSSVLVYRSRSNRRDTDLFSGVREDVLRRAEPGWQLAQRTILLDQAVIDARNISILI